LLPSRSDPGTRVNCEQRYGNPWHRNFGPWGEWYLNYLGTGRWLSASGPMWFTFALLVFSLVWAGGRGLRSGPLASVSAGPPSGWLVLGFALLLGTADFLVRVDWPLGTNWLNMQFCYFSQYVGAFVVGVSVARRRSNVAADGQ